MTVLSLARSINYTREAELFAKEASELDYIPPELIDSLIERYIGWRIVEQLTDQENHRLRLMISNSMEAELSRMRNKYNTP